MAPALSFPPELLLKAQGIRVAFFDVDGVLTDGGLYLSDQGEALKRFNILDGLGVKLLQRAMSDDPKASLSLPPFWASGVDKPERKSRSHGHEASPAWWFVHQRREERACCAAQRERAWHAQRQPWLSSVSSADARLMARTA